MTQALKGHLTQGQTTENIRQLNNKNILNSIFTDFVTVMYCKTLQ